MDKVVADTYVPGQRTNGDFKILDMDNLALGTKVEGSGKTYAEVVEDPLNEKGHVLHYTSAFNHPFVDITLPTGVTLGDLRRTMRLHAQKHGMGSCLRRKSNG